MDKWSPAVQKLIKLAMSADRKGCLESIPSMTADELNTTIDANGSTFLSKAASLEELEVVEALLNHGAIPTTTAWVGALKSNNLTLILTMASHL